MWEKPNLHCVVHEAGHGVVGTLLGLTRREANIKPWKRAAPFKVKGVVTFDAPKTRRSLRASIVMAMANKEAEIELLGCSFEGEPDKYVRWRGIRPYRSDTRSINADPKRLRRVNLDRLRAECRALVGQHRRTIKRVADALRKKERLTGKEIRKFVSKGLPKFPCNDCRVDVLQKGDWYMAQPEIWQAALGLGWNDNLCIECLEKRLGRKLRPGILDIGPASTFFRPQPPLSARLVELWAPPSRAKSRRRRPKSCTLQDGARIA